jgi:hypothetical protein
MQKETQSLCGRFDTEILMCAFVDAVAVGMLGRNIYHILRIHVVFHQGDIAGDPQGFLMLGMSCHIHDKGSRVLHLSHYPHCNLPRHHLHQFCRLYHFRLKH